MYGARRDESVRLLTLRMQERLASGLLDAPSWDIIRSAKLAARMYAPLGTKMLLGDYVRLCKAFTDGFKEVDGLEGPTHDKVQSANSLRRDLKVQCLGPLLQTPCLTPLTTS